MKVFFLLSSSHKKKEKKRKKKTWSSSGSREGLDSSLISRQFNLKDNSENAAKVRVKLG